MSDYTGGRLSVPGSSRLTRVRLAFELLVFVYVVVVVVMIPCAEAQGERQAFD